MATDKLRVKIEGDSRSYTKAIDRARKSTKGFQKSTTAANKTTKKQGQTFTQLSYALDDAQYGFRGVQNNLQQVAVQAGLGGPLILGITAMLIGIQQLITNWDKFGDAATKNLAAVTEELAKNQDQIATVNLYAGIYQNAVVGSDDYLYALKQLKKKGFDPVNQSLEDFISLIKQKTQLAAIEAATASQTGDIYGDIIKEQIKIDKIKRGEGGSYVPTISSGGAIISTAAENEDLDIARRERKIAKFTKRIEQIYASAAKSISKIEISPDILGDGDSSGPRDKIKSVLEFGLIDSTIEQGKEWQKYAKKIVEAFATEWNLAVDGAVLKVPGVDEIDAGLKATRDRLGHNVTTLQTDVKDAGAALQSAAASAFSGLGVAIGEALAGNGDFGEKFLKILGTFMVQFGSALIALGIAESAWLASFDPVTKIVAGSALVIAGAAISSAYSEKPGGNSGAQRSEVTSSTLTPSSVQGDGSGQAGWRLDGQDLIFALEAARSDRAALS